MKKILFGTLSLIFACNIASANISYTETETVTSWERIDVVGANNCCSNRYYSSRDVRPIRPCTPRARIAEPVRVKTHTEVIDHYQVYQPVTVYKPAGTYSERRMIPVKSCNKCGM
ncbi:MAG: hypothetical protein R8M37_00725 [Alphaproteobacteria bacterium]|nr:hypothetical protein [Alphaproteobacteria bacterium]